MKELDINYICTQIGNLSGIPVRVFRGGDSVFFHAITGLSADPAKVWQNELTGISGRVGYLATEDFYYFGVVNAGEDTIVVGPTWQTERADRELRELAFRADVPKDAIPDFLAGMKSIVQMPLESVLQMMCVLNYVLNGEKLELQDILISEKEQSQFRRRPEKQPDEESAPHNTLSIEEKLMGFIRRGDVASLKAWMKSAPAVRGGTLALNELRQLKNTFIVTATLASRAAIQSGLDAEEALSLSDRFIKSCELLSSQKKLIDLRYHMLVDYTERVDSVRKGKNPTKLALAVSNYIRQHISETITVENMAGALYLSRPYLSARFRQETGETLTDFILTEKTEEAKRLLRYSDKSVSAIGAYLGFSSLGHFSRTFKKYASLSPNEYRARYR